MRRHVAIAGTGRAGTSFLVQLLTKLGLDTGFSEEDVFKKLDPLGRAGLESNLREENAPYVVKSPNLSNYIHEILESSEIGLDLVIIPVRDILNAVQSRVDVSNDNLNEQGFFKRNFGSKRGFAGGMLRTSNPEKQQLILLKSLSHLLVECAKHEQKVVLPHYPRLMDDPAYLYRVLRPILGDISEERFTEVHQLTVKPEWLNRTKR
ncbi:MAG: hypothetical protein ACPGU4_03265 [Flavobacteriales bacterium]